MEFYEEYVASHSDSQLFQTSVVFSPTKNI